MEEQLSRPYKMFCQRFPDMMYAPDDILLLNINENEYEDTFRNSCQFLGLPYFPHMQHENTPSAFSAEVLKSGNKAVIMINSCYRDNLSWSNKTIVHELCHIYYDYRNSHIESALKTPLLKENDHLLRIGVLLWREFSAKYMTVLVIDRIDEPRRDAIRQEFGTLLDYPDIFSERLGSFWAKTLIYHWNDDFSSVLGLDKSNPFCKDLLHNMEGSMEYLSSALSPPRFFSVDYVFMIELGKMSVQFAYYYLSYFDMITDFIGIS